MPRIEIAAAAAASAISHLDVPGGGNLMELCDQVLAPIPFSCRAASCGTCQVEVLSGEEHLEPPSEEELDLLALVEGPHGCRFACQVQVKPGDGLLQLRARNTD